MNYKVGHIVKFTNDNGLQEQYRGKVARIIERSGISWLVELLENHKTVYSTCNYWDKSYIHKTMNRNGANNEL